MKSRNFRNAHSGGVVSPQGIFYKPPKNEAPLPPGAPVVWMQKPQAIPGCPIGLEYLTQVDQLCIYQKVSLLEAVIGWDACNKYFINNNCGNQVYVAIEGRNYSPFESETCMRICCGYQRGFVLHIVDNLNKEVIRMRRDFKCCAGHCCWLPGKELVMDVHKKFLSNVLLENQLVTGSMWRPKYDVLNEKREPILKIQGPSCVCDGPFCPCNNEFQILTIDGLAQIGSINKDYSGFVREMVTITDTFSIKFPMDLAVKAKALLIGALFLIDFMHFEKSGDDF
ncbi:phospholipid scramblase 2-like isoform X1 [Brachionus plicatilis]|uniref:Phospholipid scramblase n=1 Tax=Brachionus plicatilis TaxID=10195 RepID=A0A3M7TAR0_BRAPC|nr:phospholipid scramblase 2-like isoform X1 [Brachionus plicatilis]